MPKWTDGRIELLKTLCGQGFSGGAIMGRLNAEPSDGSAFTRNMVIGKARRLGFAFTPRKDRPQKPKSPPAPVKVTPSPVARAVPVVAKLPQEGARFSTAPKPIEPTPVNPESAVGSIHILDLRDHHCRAVLPRRGADGLAMFCGEPKAVGSSYCGFHHGLFIQPPKETVHGKASNG